MPNLWSTPTGQERPGVHDLIARWVERHPTACAVSEAAHENSLTYAELWDRAGRLAGELAVRGTRPGDLVATAAAPSIDLVVAFLGILRAGAAYVPLDPHAPRERIATVLAESRASLVVVGSDFGGQAGTGDWLTRLPGHVPTLTVPQAASGDGHPAFTYVPRDWDDAAYVCFTSGSTGRPKGVVVPHRAVARLVLEAEYCPIGPGDRVASLANPAFDATTFEVWSTLAAGATVVVLPTPAEMPVDDWIAQLSDQSITTMFLTTSLFHTLARERPSAFATLKNLVVGGEQLDMGAVRRILAADPPSRLVNGYGPTETTTFAASYTCTPDSLRGLERVPIGFALQRTTLQVLDEELGPVPPGTIGELCIGGPGVAVGYLGQPELTEERFVTDPRSGETVYRTGDLVRELPCGALEVLGRRDRQVKVRGFRIELEEIEQAAQATGRAEAAFVEKVGEGPSAALVGFVLPAAGTDAEAGELGTELRTLLADRLPSYMIPTRWTVLDQVPLGPTGKADRKAMLAALSVPPPPPPPAAAAGPASETTGDSAAFALVGPVVADVLGLTEVSAKDNFIDLGGNSILAVQVVSRIAERLKAAADAAELLLADTLGEFAGTVPVREVTAS
ncbi:non-ribosomal peptide synthetase [Streptomyces sp. NBC_00885]|uniref:non-ribosomal peptide synthetase n=1 Tax=Streptomyces sp. NBC_00885 TaxID=2975857 RepID=UPI0038660FA0|nr:non-ribosomal peptide synthetase [Streptomyces sp. NBC_00885]